MASEDGKVNTVVPGSPADKAGLAPAMSIAAVNGRKYSGQRLRDGISESVARGNVELLVIDGDRFRTVTVEYNGGPRYLELARHPEHADTVAAILKARVKPSEEK